MKIEEIETQWAKDTIVDKTKLGEEALKTLSLHSEYYLLLNQEKVELRQLKHREIQLKHILEGYYSRTLTDKEMIEWGLPDMPDKKVLKADIPKCINVYPDTIELKNLIGEISDKINFLESIIMMIKGRGFLIKDAIKWAMFEVGEYL